MMSSLRGNGKHPARVLKRGSKDLLRPHEVTMPVCSTDLIDALMDIRAKQVIFIHTFVLERYVYLCPHPSCAAVKLILQPSLLPLCRIQTCVDHAYVVIPSCMGLGIVRLAGEMLQNNEHTRKTFPWPACQYRQACILKQTCLPLKLVPVLVIPRRIGTVLVHVLLRLLLHYPDDYSLFNPTPSQRSTRSS
jgi:hypothetical protein